MEPPPRPGNEGRRRTGRLAAIQVSTAGQGAAINSPDSFSRSSSKRPRSDVEPSDSDPRSAVGKHVATTEFSAKTKKEIERDGDDCWHCRSVYALEHVHIISKRRKNILAELQSLGKTSVENLEQKENGMCLCVLCHRGLDDHESPAWVFVPTNIEYFIQAEKDDYIRRIAILEQTGDFPKRIPPTPKGYIKDCGGLYDVFMLRQHGAQDGTWVRGRSAYQPTPKVWHGDPMLAILKGTNAIGRAVKLLPEKLLDLAKLYESHDDAPPREVQTHHDHDHDDVDVDNPDVPTAGGGRDKGRPNASATRGNRSRGQVYKSRGAKRQLGHDDIPDQVMKRVKVEVLPWKWGPKMSSNDQVAILKRFSAGVRQGGFLLGSRGTKEKGGRYKKKTKEPHSPKDCDAKDERVLRGVGPEGVREWLSNTS